MHVKKLLFCLFSSLFIIFGFSQNDKLFYGKILSSGFPVKNVDVVNINSRKVAVTNDKGEFTIAAKENDILFITKNNYVDQNITLISLLFEKNNLLILFEKKPVELDEVKIISHSFIKPKLNYNQANAIKIEKQRERPVNTSVYTGEIVNGADFMQIGKMILGIFIKNKKKKSFEEKQFTQDYLKNNFSEAYFLKSLNLRPFEIDRFITFCKNDSNYDNIIDTRNDFLVADFLFSKRKTYTP